MGNRPGAPGRLPDPVEGHILALATSNFETIATAIIAILSEARKVHYDWQILELAPDGATVDHV